MLIPIVPNPNLLVPFTNLLTFNGTTGVNSRSGYTLLTKIPAALITQSGSTVRLVLESAGVNCTLNNVTISAGATSGNAWNSAATPTAVTLAGSASWAITGVAGTLFTSDEIAFSVTGAQALVVGVNMGAFANATRLRNGLNSGTGLLAGVVAYEKAGVQEADDASRGSSYAAQSNRCYYIRAIDIK